MKCENIDNYSVYDYSLVKYTKMGNVTQVVSLAHKNNECPIQKINKDDSRLVTVQSGKTKRQKNSALYTEEAFFLCLAFFMSKSREGVV